MTAGNTGVGGSSGGSLTERLTEKTSFLGMRVYVVIGICVGLGIAVALVVVFVFCSNRRWRNRRMRVKHASGLIPMISKEIVEIKSSNRTERVSAVDLEEGEGKVAEVRLRSAESNLSGGSQSSSSAVSAEMSGMGWGRWYGMRELEVATGGFSEENVIGEGGYGIVYKGVLADRSVIAIKSLLNNK